MSTDSGIALHTIKKNSLGKEALHQDQLCIEEPLEYRVPFKDSDNKNAKMVFKTLAITMRTPGNDVELATGFLFSEGIIQSVNDIECFRYNAERGDAGAVNSLEIHLRPALCEQFNNSDRRFTTYSSCGLCGKTSIQSLELQNPPILDDKPQLISVDVIKGLSSQMMDKQQLFQSTGAAHASGLFDNEGRFLKLFEDVGRHNALDKLIGHFLKHDPQQLKQSLLFLSGRISFDLVQKAIMAGIPTIVAVGAPSSLALDTAKRFNLTLVGFLRSGEFNIYHGGFRIINDSC